MSQSLLLICDHDLTEKTVRASLHQSQPFKHAHLEVIRSLGSALKELSVRDYDLILINCENSALSPLEIIIQLKAVRRDTPLVIMNKPGREKTAINCLKHGCDHYLIMDEKWPQELPEVLEGVIESHFFKRNLRQRFYALEQENQRLQEASIYDQSSSFYSGPYFKSVVARELKRASRHKIDLSCLILDVNTTSKKRKTKSSKTSSLANTLQDLASLLKGVVRSTDVWARLSDSRFAALMPHTSNKQAKQALKRLQNELTGSAINLDDKTDLRFSWGVSVFNEKKIKNEEDFLRHAEASLVPA